MAVDTEQVSTASDAVVSRGTNKISECVPTVVPKLAAAPQAASEVIQPRPPDCGGTDNCREPLGLDTAISVTTVVSEKWMDRFVMDLDVLCSDGLASGDDPAKESSDVGSDVCVVSDSMPTAVSVRRVVTEEWMDQFVMDLVECPSVSRTSAVARTFGPAVSEEYSPVVFAGGGGGRGGGCRCIPPGCQ